MARQWDGAASHLLPPLCQDNKVPKSPLQLSSLPFPPRPHPPLKPISFLGHDCAGVVGSPASGGGGHLAAKEEKQKNSMGWNKREGRRATKELFLSRLSEF